MDQVRAKAEQTANGDRGEPAAKRRKKKESGEKSPQDCSAEIVTRGRRSWEYVVPWRDETHTDDQVIATGGESWRGGCRAGERGRP